MEWPFAPLVAGIRGLFQITLSTVAISLTLYSAGFAHTALAEEVSAIAERVSQCDLGIPLDANEREALIQKLQSTRVGAELIEQYNNRYGSLETLVIQWDGVSYSQILTSPAQRGLAAQGKEVEKGKGRTVCVHLARKLPDIEHLADLSHELVHAARMDLRSLKKLAHSSDEFISNRLKGLGGEAEAFSTECRVKFEVLGRWDNFCRPYVDVKESQISLSRVIEDLYNGKLSASLTGETYPVMLSKQFRRISAEQKSNSKAEQDASAQ